MTKHLSKISDHLHLNPIIAEGSSKSYELQKVIDNYKKFNSDSEISTYFAEDDGLPVRLDGLAYQINLITKRSDITMNSFVRRMVQQLFTLEYQMTHSWRVAEGEGERYVTDSFYRLQSACKIFILSIFSCACLSPSSPFSVPSYVCTYTYDGLILSFSIISRSIFSVL